MGAWTWRERELDEIENALEHNLKVCFEKAKPTEKKDYTKMFFEAAANTQAVSFMFNRQFAKYVYCGKETAAQEEFAKRFPGIYDLMAEDQKFKDAHVAVEL